jgi:hypothetical protein
MMRLPAVDPTRRLPTPQEVFHGETNPYRLPQP